jgi:hypothetical protein
MHAWKAGRYIEKIMCGALQWNDEQKAASLMLRENMINLVKVVTEKEIFESLQRTKPEKKMR